MNHENVEQGNLYEINNLDIQDVRKLREAEVKEGYFDLSHLSPELKDSFEKILINNVHTFSKSYQILGQMSLVSSSVTLQHDFPMQTKPYKLPQAVRQYAKNEIDNFLKVKIIKKTDSNYAFPVNFVKKKANA